MKQINLQIEADQLKILKKQKEKNGIPVNFQIRQAIDLYIKTNKIGG